VQLYEAQISKMQLALERADQDNSRLEQELRALREAHRGKEERRGSSSLAALRDRVRSISGLATPLEQQAAERLQVRESPPPLGYGVISASTIMYAWCWCSILTSCHAWTRVAEYKGGDILCAGHAEVQCCAWQDAGEKLKVSQHERSALQKQRDTLARQLAHIANKIASGIIPEPAELAVPDHIAAAAEASAGLEVCGTCPFEGCPLMCL
jgi:hypothetical protein